jgi:hypothetical protein
MEAGDALDDVQAAVVVGAVLGDGLADGDGDGDGDGDDTMVVADGLGLGGIGVVPGVVADETGVGDAVAPTGAGDGLSGLFAVTLPPPELHAAVVAIAAAVKNVKIGRLDNLVPPGGIVRKVVGDTRGRTSIGKSSTCRFTCAKASFLHADRSLRKGKAKQPRSQRR